MAIYGVTFVQNHVYWVEADNESEAESKAYEKFKDAMTSPVANCIYDEVIVDEVIENEEEELTMEGKYLMPDEYDIYLEGLRRSGVTNMYGATKYLEYEFSLDKADAREILASWMKNYNHIDYSMCTDDQFDYDYYIF